MFNPPLQQKYRRQHKLSYQSTPVFHQYSAWRKLNLLLKHQHRGHVTGQSCVEYSVWGLLRGVV